MQTIEDLYAYLVERNILSEENINTLQVILAELGEIMPGDKMQASRKDQRLIEESEDLSWIKLVINRYIDKKKTEYNRTRDGSYTMLVRQNRPSNEAICCEIRTKNPTIYDIEEELSTLNNILIWVEHLEKSIDRYVYALRDKFRKDSLS